MNLFQDNAPHFKNQYMMHYYALEFPIDMNLNYFCEYHGKCAADTFFSFMGRIKVNFEKYNKIEDASQLISIYNEYFKENGKLSRKNKLNIYSFIQLNEIPSHSIRSGLIIKNVKNYYYFKFKEKQVTSGVTYENVETQIYEINLNEEYIGIKMQQLHMKSTDINEIKQKTKKLPNSDAVVNVDPKRIQQSNMKQANEYISKKTD
eukprot:gene9918-2240_t